MNSKEKRGLGQWLESDAKDPVEAGELQQLWEKTAPYKEDFTPNVEAGLAKLQARIAAEKQQSAKIVTMQPRRWALRVAAALAFLLVSTIFVKNYFQPGTASLQNLTTQQGKTSELRLADGSLIALNQGSSIDYPERFSGSERKVRLSGEAFFEVAKDPSKPFLIETQWADVQVLGTSFNVRSYPEEGLFELTVKTGKVAVTVKSSRLRHELMPGEKLVLTNADAQPQLLRDDSGNALAWKTRRLRFTKAADLGDIFQSVERLYGIRFEMENEALKNCRYVASFDAHQLPDVFKAMESSLNIRITESTVGVYQVKGEGCKN